MIRILFILIVFIQYSTYADNPDASHKSTDYNSILWANTDFPPAHITKGELKGQGFADQLILFMTKNLTDYQHNFITYPSVARLQNELQKSKDKTICASSIFYRDHEKRKAFEGRQVYSAPNYIFFLHDIIVKKSKRHLYKDVESFEELLNNQDLIYGYSRTNGPVASTILGNYLGLGADASTVDARTRLRALKEKKNILVRLGSNIVSGPLQMLARDRIDYIMEYEFAVRYEAARLGLEDEFAAIPVKETLNQIGRSSYSCSSTELGKKVIMEINKILVKHRGTEEYKKFMSLIEPTSTERRERYWEVYNQTLKIVD